MSDETPYIESVNDDLVEREREIAFSISELYEDAIVCPYPDNTVQLLIEGRYFSVSVESLDKQL